MINDEGCVCLSLCFTAFQCDVIDLKFSSKSKVCKVYSLVKQKISVVNFVWFREGSQSSDFSVHLILGPNCLMYNLK